MDCECGIVNLELLDLLKEKDQRIEELEDLIKQVYDIAFESPELNINNYDDVDASRLNDAMIGIFTLLNESN